MHDWPPETHYQETAMECSMKQILAFVDCSSTFHSVYMPSAVKKGVDAPGMQSQTQTQTQPNGGHESRTQRYHCSPNFISDSQSTLPYMRDSDRRSNGRIGPSRHCPEHLHR